MSEILSVTEQVVKVLADHLKKEVKALRQVYDEFPDTNIRLVTPSASIMTAAPIFTPHNTKAIEIPSIVDNGYRIQYIRGHYEFPLQLDLWAGNKRQRSDIFESVFTVLNSMDGPAGLDLPLTGYYNQFAHYHVRRYDFNESEAGSQRRERRVRIDMMADANAVVERQESAMVSIEINDADNEVEVTDENLNETEE